MNTETVNNGIEVYTHRLFTLADEYIQERLKGKEEDVQKNFRDLIFFMADRIEKPDNSEIELLDGLFEAYTRVCARYGKLPTLECFSWLVKIDRNTFTDWQKKEYRSSTAHSSTVKKWLNICRGFTVDELSNSKFANPNLIFIAKAAYGMRETAPLPALETENKRVLTASELPKLGNKSKQNDITELPNLSTSSGQLPDLNTFNTD
ncbi:hypothetical protein AALB81_18715 [Lachnospiraceae bacterium 48-33]|jgi:hypothetical protein